MDILIYSKPEKVEHKMQKNFTAPSASVWCYWKVGIVPSDEKLSSINFVYFSDGKKIFAKGLFLKHKTLPRKEISFRPLLPCKKIQPRKPPLRGWCYI